MRVVIADDEMLLREGLARLLADAGVEVVGTVGTPTSCCEVELTRPDVAIVDIRMPPTHTDEGLVAAQEIRARASRRSACSCSRTTSSRTTRCGCSRSTPSGAGYLLKERVSDVAVLVDALQRIAEGECVVDPTIVARLLERPREEGPLDELTEREREVLGLIAEGHSNEGIRRRLFLSPKTVETHVRHILLKLGIGEAPDYHRRVLSGVLAYLRR